MTAQVDLRERLKKIEALIEGAATPEERHAAEAAIARVRAKLDAPSETNEPEELQFSIADDWSRHLFVALCRRNGLRPYRNAADDRATVTLHAPRSFVEGTLWRQYQDIEAELRAYLTEISLTIIRKEVFADASDAQEVLEALPAPEPELLLEPAEELPPPPPAPPPRPHRWFGWGKLIRFDRRGRIARTRH
jgi:hypothetical protein